VGSGLILEKRDEGDGGFWSIFVLGRRWNEEWRGDEDRGFRFAGQIFGGVGDAEDDDQLAVGVLGAADEEGAVGAEMGLELGETFAVLVEDDIRGEIAGVAGGGLYAHVKVLARDEPAFAGSIHFFGILADDLELVVAEDVFEFAGDGAQAVRGSGGVGTVGGEDEAAPDARRGSGRRLGGAGE